MNRGAKLYASDIASFYFFATFCFVSYIYFYFFSIDNVLDYEPIKGFLFPVNTHDHAVYLDYINRIYNDELKLSINNNIGIAYIYFILLSFFSLFFDDVDVYYLSFSFNLLVLFLCFLSYRSIILEFKLKSKLILTFFTFSFLVYFAQLINKDVLTILISLKLVLYLKKKSNVGVLMLMGLSFFVRFQLPVFIFLCWFLCTRKRNHLLLLFSVYIFLSLLNAYLSRYQTYFLSESTIGNGLSYLVFYLNQNYYVGSILLNPIRVFQYFQDYYKSFFVFTEAGLDVSRLKNIPHLIYFTFVSPYLFRAYINYRSRMNTDMKYLLSVGVAFFLIWLFNPTINSRYLICFLPIFQVICLYEREMVSSKYNSILVKE